MVQKQSEYETVEPSLNQTVAHSLDWSSEREVLSDSMGEYAALDLMYETDTRKASLLADGTHFGDSGDVTVRDFATPIQTGTSVIAISINNETYTKRGYFIGKSMNNQNHVPVVKSDHNTSAE